MEWSEAVLLQLCYIDEELDIPELTWSSVKRILHYQWRLEVTIPLQEHVGSKETLSNIIIRNHSRKVQLGLIHYSDMFTPEHRTNIRVNYALLNEYTMENKLRMNMQTRRFNHQIKMH